MNIDLKLPVIKEDTPKPKHLSMDEYLEFVNFGREINRNEKKNRDKRSIPVNVKFSI